LAGSARHESVAAVDLSTLRKLPPIYQLAYTYTDTDARVEAVRQQLIATCMAKVGLSYNRGVPAKVGDTIDEPVPFGLETLTQPDELSVPQEQHIADDQRYVQALYGDNDKRITAHGARISVSQPGNGCLAEAEQRLLGDGRARWIQLRVLLFEAEVDAREQLERDESFGLVNARWQDCMTQAGFTYPNPLQVIDTLPPLVTLATYPPAQADLACKDATDYLSWGYTRLAAIQWALLDRDPSVVADWKSLLLRQARAADELAAP
jgi:hypothetical protein